MNTAPTGTETDAVSTSATTRQLRESHPQRARGTDIFAETFPQEDEPAIVSPRSGERPLQSVPDQHRCRSCGQRLTDPPTGLIERWRWDDQAAVAIARSRGHGRSVALIMIDLDRFKDVNDTYGHIAGDTILRGVADVIHRSTRSDDLACRYGGSAGDEFLVLLPDTDMADALSVAERIRTGIGEMTVTAKVTRELSATIDGQTASIGVATFCQGDLAELDLEELMLDADVALRAAKRHGRDRICVANVDLTGAEEQRARAGRRMASWSRFRRLRSV